MNQVLAWAANGCSATLEEAASIATAGCAGFEAFSIHGSTMLAAANFWDGRLLTHTPMCCVLFERVYM
jgi:hypothetical protein